MRTSYLTISWRRIVASWKRRFESVRPFSKYHIFFLQLLDFLDGKAEHPTEDLLIVLAQNGRGAAKLSRCTAEAMLQSFIWRRAHVLMFEPVPEIEGLEIFVLMDVHAVLHRIRGDTRSLQPRSQIIVPNDFV